MWPPVPPDDEEKTFEPVVVAKATRINEEEEEEEDKPAKKAAAVREPGLPILARTALRLSPGDGAHAPCLPATLFSWFAHLA